MYPSGVDDHARSLTQTSDGGYVLAGHMQPPNDTYHHAYIVKVDASGNMQWNKTYAGAYTDEAHDILQASDGGYVVAGMTSPTNASNRFWVFKVDASGNLQWNKTYGGPYNDNAWSLVQTSDGGYAIAGYNASIGDALLVRTDSNGNQIWSKTYGGPGNDTANSVVEASDGGYVLAGSTDSYGAGKNDFWLVRTKGLW